MFDLALYTLLVTTRVEMSLFPANIYLLKTNNKNIRKKCEICSKLTSFCCFSCWFWTYFTPFSSVIIVDYFQQINVSWVFLERYSRPCQISTMVPFCDIMERLKAFNNYQKISTLDTWQCLEYFFGYNQAWTFEVTLQLIFF